MVKLFIILILSLFAGCAASPKGVYKSLSSADRNSVAYTFADAINFANPIEITNAEKFEFKLEEGDPVIELDHGRPFRSYYKLIKFDGNGGQTFSFKITSLCQCYTVFRETIIYPIAFILDSEGDVLSSIPIKWKRKHDFLLTGLEIEGLWEAELPEDGNYFLLIAADNSYVGLTLAINYPLLIPDSPETYILSSPSGKVRVEMNPEVEFNDSFVISVQ